MPMLIIAYCFPCRAILYKESEHFSRQYEANRYATCINFAYCRHCRLKPDSESSPTSTLKEFFMPTSHPDAHRPKHARCRSNVRSVSDLSEHCKERLRLLADSIVEANRHLSSIVDLRLTTVQSASTATVSAARPTARVRPRQPSPPSSFGQASFSRESQPPASPSPSASQSVVELTDSPPPPRRLGKIMGMVVE